MSEYIFNVTSYWPRLQVQTVMIDLFIQIYRQPLIYNPSHDYLLAYPYTLPCSRVKIHAQGVTRSSRHIQSHLEHSSDNLTCSLRELQGV